ncbi:hypothetical protein GGI07_002096 [Coemansia sp. Benny D115]|nr:hypothetical protein GGI07_002096 [Coemansia sp. Benny D115]
MIVEAKSLGVPCRHTQQTHCCRKNSNSNSNSIPVTGSSGKQQQMVFTVGTFDENEYDANTDNDSQGESECESALRSRFRATRSSPVIAENPSAEATQQKPSPNSVDPPATPTSRTPPETSDEHVPASNILRSDAASNRHAAPAQKGGAQQPARQPLFTMGSHSEVSDLDCVDGYEPSGDAFRDGGAHLKQKHSAEQHHQQEQQQQQQQQALGTRTGNLPPNAKAHHAAANARPSTQAPEQPQRDDASAENSRSPPTLHACKAMSSLAQLAQPSETHSYEDAEATDFQENSSKDAALRERVTSEPVFSAPHPLDPTSPRAGKVAFGVLAEDDRSASEGLLRSSRGKAPAGRDSQLRPRKRSSARKPHIKKPVSSAALRGRTRHGTAHRRDTQSSKTQLYAGVGTSSNVALNEANDSHFEGSYVDYSDSDEDIPRTEAATVSRLVHPHVVTLDQTRASMNSSTATLGGGACQDVDDSATTASIDSPRAEQSENMSRPQQQQQQQSTVAAAAPADSAQNGSTEPEPRQETQSLAGAPTGLRRSPRQQELYASAPQQSQSQSQPQPQSQPQSQPPQQQQQDQHQQQQQRQGRMHIQLSGDNDRGLATAPLQSGHQPPNNGLADAAGTQRADGANKRPQRTANGRRATDEQQKQQHAATAAAAASVYDTGSANRTMESQRQQSMIEDMESEMRIVSSQLTGMPIRKNQPASMQPHIFIMPNTPANAQQVRKTERVYAYVRATSHPLLESISRCVALREQRAAMGIPRVQPQHQMQHQLPSRSWATRRTLTEPSESDLQSEWWDSLMPPPPTAQTSPLMGREQQRGVPGQSGKIQHTTELPNWIMAPDEAKCAVYGPDLDATAGMSVPGLHHRHENLDPSCEHVRELRMRAKELRLTRQQALSAGRNHAMPTLRPPSILNSPASTTAALETWRGRRVPGLLSVEMYAGATRPLDLGAAQAHGQTQAQGAQQLQNQNQQQQQQRFGSDHLTSASPDSVKLGKANQIAPPYRRNGTVYGCTQLNQVNPHANNGFGVAAYHAGGNAGNNMPAVGVAGRGADIGYNAMRSSIAGVTPGAGTAWENDPRRSSYFDRLSVDEGRPALSTSAAQGTAAGFLRRVISGLAGGTAAAFGTSQ